MLIVVDLRVSLWDHSLYRCPEHPLMAQVIGQPWHLEPGQLSDSLKYLAPMRLIASNSEIAPYRLLGSLAVRCSRFAQGEETTYHS